MKTLVYRHRRLDNNEVFYVGIGNKTRPYKRSNRTEYWKRIVDKAGYSVEILKECDNLEDAQELEEFLISLYGRKDLGTGCLINMTSGGEGNFGLKHTQRSKKLISKNNARYWEGKKRPNFKSKASQKVLQYSLSGDLINTFNSITEAFRKTKIPRGGIGLSCNKKIEQSYGFVWMFGKDKNKRLSNLPKKFVVPNREIIQLDLNENVIKIFKNSDEASIESGINKKSITRVCSGVRKTSGGYIWKYKDNNIKNEK